MAFNRFRLSHGDFDISHLGLVAYNLEVELPAFLFLWFVITSSSKRMAGAEPLSSVVTSVSF
jgi:hypothetical protein